MSAYPLLSPMGRRPSRRALLLSTGAAAAGAAVAGVAARSSPPIRSSAAPRYLVTVIAQGGWDPTYSFDPKLGLPGIQGPELDADPDDPEDVEAVRTWGELPVLVNDRVRPNVSAFFDRWHDRAHVVNGVWMGTISHAPCLLRILTGTARRTNADLTTVFGFATGDGEPFGSVDLSGWSLAGPLAASTGRVGYQSQLKALVDPTTVFHAPADAPWTYPLFEPGAADDAAVSAYLAARAAAFGSTIADGGHNDARIADLLQSWARGAQLRAQSDAIVGGLQLGVRPGLGDQVLLCVDLLDAGLCRAVTLDSRSHWDTHENNADQHGFLDDLFLHLDQLATELDARGMLDSTVVQVVSEMGRSPLRNAGAGKDHWPHTSALLFGAGIRGSAVSGATDDRLESLTVDLETGAPYADRAQGALCKYDNLGAGLLELLGVDPEAWLPGIPPFRGFRA